MWLSEAKNKELSAALLLDLRAAFDIVDHEIFLKKLKSYNFSNKTIDWFKQAVHKEETLIDQHIWLWTSIWCALGQKRNCWSLEEPKADIL